VGGSDVRFGAEERDSEIMLSDPLKILTKRIRVRSLIFAAFLIAYIGFSLLLFVQWVAPSLDGRTQQHIGADSVTYLYFADSLRSGNVDPWVIASLASFPNTLWAPVLLALALKSTFAMVVANYAMFFLALILLKKSYSFSTGAFVLLLLLNATTTISLLSVNKEIVDLLAVSIFLFAYRRSSKSLLLLALVLALFNRYEVCLVMLIFLLAESKLNPWRRRRVLTLVVLTIALSVTLPLFAGATLSTRLEETVNNSGAFYVWLNAMEMHYLYGVAVIPKIAYNLFAELENAFSVEAQRLHSDIANSYIVLSNNLANVIVLGLLVSKRRLTVRSDIIYFAMLGCIIMAISLVVQPRYFYIPYVLFCLQAAQTGAGEPAVGIFLHKQGGVDRHISSPDHNEATFD
jgi:hypothetical protein